VLPLSSILVCSGVVRCEFNSLFPRALQIASYDILAILPVIHQLFWQPLRRRVSELVVLINEFSIAPSNISVWIAFSPLATRLSGCRLRHGSEGIAERNVLHIIKNELLTFLDTGTNLNIPGRDRKFSLKIAVSHR